MITRVNLIALCLVSCCFLTALNRRALAQESSRPNVLMIISDDQAWTDYSFMGHEQIETPSLDQLAKQSVVFRRGYVPTALCRPSLMTMITGRYAHQHGVTGNDPSFKYAPRGSELQNKRRQELIKFVDRFDTLPRVLSKAGYLCLQTGKWWEGNFKQGGFTHGMTRGFPRKGGRHGDDGLKIGRQGIKPITDFLDLTQQEKKPFFIWYAPFLPHTPHKPPKELFEKYTKKGMPTTVAKYYAMCEWFDQTCGEILSELDERDLADDTIVVYVCDNGWIQNPKANGYAPRSKQTAYEGGIRTPIMFRWPNKFAAADRTELCSSIDLMPTLLHATGQDVPDDLPGLNLLPAMKSGTPIARKTIFGEGFAHDIADLHKPEATLLYRWCVRGRWKLLLTYDGEVNRYQSTHPRDIKGPQLFDLEEDPHERTNLAKQHTELVKELSASIEDWYPLTERKLVE